MTAVMLPCRASLLCTAAAAREQQQGCCCCCGAWTACLHVWRASLAKHTVLQVSARS